MSGLPETRFVRSDGVDIGYQVVGAGDIDVAFVPGWISNWEVAWELPESASFLERFASYSRLILFDKRGTGLSDRVPGVPTLEEHVDDLRTVLDAVGSRRVAITGWADGAAGAVVCPPTCAPAEASRRAEGRQPRQGARCPPAHEGQAPPTASTDPSATPNGPRPPWRTSSASR